MLLWLMKHMPVPALEEIFTYKTAFPYRSTMYGNARLFMLYKNMLFNLGANMVI
jgi:hypothetical protein